MYLCTFVLYVTGPAKINHVSAKIVVDFSSFALSYLTLETDCTNKTMSLSLLQNLWKRDTTFRAEDISKNITWLIFAGWPHNMESMHVSNTHFSD